MALVGLAVLGSSTAWASPELKAVSAMYDIKAETFRFVRLQREILISKSDPILSKKLRAQLKDSTQGLMNGVQEAAPGLNKLGMQKQQQQMGDTVSGYLAEWAAAAGSGNVDLDALRAKRLAMQKLSDDIGKQAIQKSGAPAARQTALIGASKSSIQKLAFDYEFCDPNCAQVLPADMADLEKNLDEMRGSVAKYFKNNSYDLARNQITMLKSAVNNRLSKGINPADQKQVIGVSDNLWTMFTEVQDSYADSN